MENKYDAAKSKQRRIQFFMILMASVFGYVLIANLIIPTTSLEENLWVVVKSGFLLSSIIACVGLLANLFAELNHVFKR